MNVCVVLNFFLDLKMSHNWIVSLTFHPTVRKRDKINLIRKGGKLLRVVSILCVKKFPVNDLMNIFSKFSQTTCTMITQIAYAAIYLMLKPG